MTNFDRRRSRKGKTYEELYGEEKSMRIKKKLRIVMSEVMIGNVNALGKKRSLGT